MSSGKWHNYNTQKENKIMTDESQKLEWEETYYNDPLYVIQSKRGKNYDQSH